MEHRRHPRCGAGWTSDARSRLGGRGDGGGGGGDERGCCGWCRATVHGETAHMAARRFRPAAPAARRAPDHPARRAVLGDGRALLAARPKIGGVRGVRPEGRSNAFARRAHPRPGVRAARVQSRARFGVRRGPERARHKSRALPDVRAVLAGRRARACGVRAAARVVVAARRRRRAMRHRAHGFGGLSRPRHVVGPVARLRGGRGERGVLPPRARGGGRVRHQGGEAAVSSTREAAGAGDGRGGFVDRAGAKADGGGPVPAGRAARGAGVERGRGLGA
mmetsp:Transcript_7277/g.31018  ORF Transcript_7277/g.31018 Transcript_7277/m.31018 type:complete len:278 (+) Transcript_7277:588-1421(+)